MPPIEVGGVGKAESRKGPSSVVARSLGGVPERHRVAKPPEVTGTVRSHTTNEGVLNFARRLGRPVAHFASVAAAGPPYKITSSWRIKVS